MDKITVKESQTRGNFQIKQEAAQVLTNNHITKAQELDYLFRVTFDADSNIKDILDTQVEKDITTATQSPKRLQELKEDQERVKKVKNPRNEFTFSRRKTGTKQKGTTVSDTKKATKQNNPYKQFFKETETKIIWQDKANCANADTELFFEPKYQRIAQDYCRDCPVQTECLQDAMGAYLQFGIWGGTTAKERKQIKNKQRNK